MDVNRICEYFVLAKKLHLQKDIISECLRDLESLGNRYKAHLIGSRALGLTIDPASDFDILLDTGDVFDGEKIEFSNDLGGLVAKIEAAMRERPKKFTLLSTLYFSRSPIIKIRHISTSLTAAVSLRPLIDVENTQLLLHMLNIAPIARPLILFFKEHYKAGGILNTSLGSYTLYVFVIFYMQFKNFLPSVIKLRSPKVAEKKVGGWDCQFSNTLKGLSLVKSEDLLGLIRGFAQFYHLNFQDTYTYVLCPFLGTRLNKSDFDDNGANLPVEMKLYKDMCNAAVTSTKNDNGEDENFKANPGCGVFKNDSYVCVQDIFDLSQNLTEAWKIGDESNFKSLLSEFCSPKFHEAAVHSKEKLRNMNWEL